jgi:hypothetical protein
MTTWRSRGLNDPEELRINVRYFNALLQLLLMGRRFAPERLGRADNINLQKLEAAAAGATTLTLSGGSITLTDDEARSSILVLNGILTGDQTIFSRRAFANGSSSTTRPSTTSFFKSQVRAALPTLHRPHRVRRHLQ